MARSALFRTKSVEQSMKDTDDPETRLNRNLGALDLIVFGVGVIVGAGIFVLTGQAAATTAGPAIAISFLVAALACGLAALCYAEFASTVPVAGSAYTFSYATFGELIAWTIGWDLVLEFTVGSAALASGFSSYWNNLVEGTFLELPAQLSTAAGTGVVDIPAIVISLLVMWVLIVGIKFSSRINQVVVAIKVAVVLLVIIAGIRYIDAQNWSPFVPPSEPPAPGEGGWLKTPLVQSLLGLDPAVYGVAGIFTGAAIVFFAFIGFDVVATTAEETHNPQRNVPIGIFGSLAIVTVLYMAVSLVITGMQNFHDIDPEDGAPLATAFDAVGVGWMGDVISVGACIGLVVVVMILMLGQTRVAFAMARDGLLPRWLAQTHGERHTPHRITFVTGIAVAAISGFVDLSTLADLVNIGTLFAFVLVSVGVVILRRTR
ncbi:amino acid permease, partial [Mumia sp.]